MATIPNRYYNSPWIADAARNLTTAMFPDEREQEALAQSRYAFQQRVKADEQAETDRANQTAAASALADILTVPEGERVARAAQAVRLAPNLTPQAFAALGTQSPEYIAKDALADQKFAAQEQLWQDRLAGQQAIWGDRLAAMMRGQDIASEDRRYASDNSLSGVLARIRARAEGTANPLRVSPADMQNFAVNAAVRAKQTGLRLDDARRDAIVNRAAELYQQGRNSGTALEQAFTEIVPPGSYSEQTEPGWFGRQNPTGVMTPYSSAVLGVPAAAPGQKPPLASFNRP